MKTKKLLSTISYNTETFLTSKCNELVKNQIFEYWFAILHQPEEDEGKAHYHICFCPTSAIDTVNLRSCFNEIDLSHPELPPLGVLPIRPSKSFSDWYLYAIHHKGYLMSKNESRFYHYNYDDVFGSNLDLLHELVSEINMGVYRCYEEVFKAVEEGASFSSLIANGLVPLGWIYQFRELFNALAHEKSLYRDQKSNHEYAQDTLIEVEKNSEAVQEIIDLPNPFPTN
jgi:hypothetical protein